VPQPNDSLVVNKATVSGGKTLAMYSFVIDGVRVESEAVTLTDGNGNELLGQQPSADSLPVVLASDQAPINVTSEPSVALTNPADTPVTAAEAVIVLPANANRAWCLIQNTGNSNVRIGGPLIAANAGIRLTPNAVMSNEQLNQFQGDIYAIAESADSTVGTLEASL
jgi:hypothetical protein